jgi:hypothetical protein
MTALLWLLGAMLATFVVTAVFDLARRVRTLEDQLAETVARIERERSATMRLMMELAIGFRWLSATVHAMAHLLNDHIRARTNPDMRSRLN